MVSSLELISDRESQSSSGSLCPPLRRGTHSLSPSGAPGPSELGLRLPLTLSAAVAAGLLRGPVPLLEDGPSPPDGGAYSDISRPFAVKSEIHLGAPPNGVVVHRLTRARDTRRGLAGPMRRFEANESRWRV